MHLYILNISMVTSHRNDLLMIFTQSMRAADDALLYSKCLRTLGAWVASSKLENPDSIMEMYLQPALDAAEETHTTSNSGIAIV